MKTLTETSKVTDFILHQIDNNIDKLDNLDQLPSAKAVYAISGRINNKPANCRFVGECEDLQATIKAHFSDAEPHACLKEFMQSIKIKTLDYILLTDSTKAERAKLVLEWEEIYKPNCNEQLNKVF